MGIVLASASPRRKELMKLITPAYRVEVSDVDESALHAETPGLLAQTLACAKCAAVAQKNPHETVLGCDTVVEVDGVVLGKPKDRADAGRMLRLLAGRAHLVHTGVCIRRGEQQHAFFETTRVFFRRMTAEEIEAYLDTPEPYDKAGGYGIQGKAACYITGIEGCYFNVMGLPVARVYEALRAMGER